MKEKKNTLVATDSTSTPGAKGKGGGRPTTAAELQPEEEYRLLNKGSSRGDWQIAKITERVYLSGVKPAKEVDRLKRLGITHVVNACGRDWWPDAAFRRDFNYLSVPLNDETSEDIRAHFPQVLDFMHGAVQEAGGKVLVHCIAGYSRSASLVVAYLIGHAALTFDEALALVKERRPVAEPNLGFANQLRAFERERAEKEAQKRQKQPATPKTAAVGEMPSENSD